MASESEGDDDHFHILQWHINHSYFHSYNTHAFFLLLSFFALLITLLASFFLLAHFCRRRLPERGGGGGGDDEKWVIKYEMESLGEKKKMMMMMEECCICLGAFKEDEKLKVLPQCEHVYHSQCLQKWLISHPTCPLCRASLHKFISNAL